MTFLFAAFLMLQTAAAPGSLSGTVILKDTAMQTPLTSVRVELSGGPGLPLVVRTDSLGRFAFGNLPPGSYHLRVSKDSFIRQEFAKRAAINIRSGEAHKPLVIAMESAPTLAGRIQNEYGEPIGNILVQALRATYGLHGERTFTPLSSALSDDHGDYRLYWLDPGEYIVSAALVPVVKTPGNPDPPPVRVIYAPTYYPNSSDLSNAQRIALNSGDQVLTLDFRLVRIAAVTIRGSTQAVGKGAISGIPVTVRMAGDSAEVSRLGAKSSDLGTFAILNVSPGDYIVSAAGVIEGREYTATNHIVVHEKDENNVGLTLSPGVPVVGRFAMESGAPMDLTGSHVHLISTDPNLDSYDPIQMTSNGQFLFSGVQHGTFALNVEKMPGDLYVKAMHSGLTNLLESPLTVDWESPPTLDITIDSGGHLSGSVVDSTGAIVPGAQVALAPGGDRRSRVDQYRASATDEDGRFEIAGIAPGEYQIFAWENVENRAWLNSDFLSRFIDKGITVTVSTNSNPTVQIPVIP